MSTAIASSYLEGEIQTDRPRATGGARHIIRRRPTIEQGRALEILGHAVEYLVDSRLYLEDKVQSDELAVQTLMRLNREIFAECAEVVPAGRRLRRWAGRLGVWGFR